MRPPRASSRIAVLAVAMLGAASLQGQAGAAGSPTPSASPEFKKVDLPDGLKLDPALGKASERVKVIVELSGDSVGQLTVEAEELGRSLATADKDAARSALAGRQRAVLDLVRARGGDVLETYQDAYNGVAVKVARADVPALRSAPGVVAVHAVRTYRPDNVSGGKYIGAPQVWQSTGFTGKGVKVAIIDSGVDYTHAGFGGPGTREAFTGNDPDVVERGTFPTGKVVGGYDFVGDAYGSEGEDVPKPDRDPLDCNGHGSHVAGSAAGSGVTSAGKTYRGPYDASTAARSFQVGPGTAPEAQIFAYKVFGCEGGTDDSNVVAALNRALRDQVDVVNMSLGSPFGGKSNVEAEAVTTLSMAGVAVVTSAGNSGPGAYITGAPGSSNRAIAVAAMDASSPTIPAARATFSSAEGALTFQNSNGEPFEPGLTLPVEVLRDDNGAISLGCSQEDYQDVEGKLVVTVRGTCARAARAVYGQKAGAAAVLMINTDEGYPPFEGPINENPDEPGVPYEVTIPFFGAPNTATDTLVDADGGTVTLQPDTLENPGYQFNASFTSAGPRNGDSAVKPDVTAPGVAVVSVGVGQGTGPATISGTSMAAPLTAGVAALVTQAHPRWSSAEIKAAIMGTARKDLVKDYDVQLNGSGVVQAQRAVSTQTVALAGSGQSSLSYGTEQIAGSYSETLTMTLQNMGSTAMTYELSEQFVGDRLGATMRYPATVTVPAGASRDVDVTLALSKAAVAALPSAEASVFGVLQSIRGALVVTPTELGAGRYPLRVPFLVAARGLSDVDAGRPTAAVKEDGGPQRYSTTVPVTNSGVHAGTAFVSSLGAESPRDKAIDGATDIRATGVATLPGEALGGESNDRGLVFTVNKFGALSNPSTSLIEIPVDVDNDGTLEGTVLGVDLGLLFAGALDGQFVAVTFDADGNAVAAYVASAPLNGSTVQLPALASDLGITSDAPRFAYSTSTTDLFGTATDATGKARYNAFSPAVESGVGAVLQPGESTRIPLRFNAASVAETKALGWLVVTLDDANGGAQADVVRVPATP